MRLLLLFISLIFLEILGKHWGLEKMDISFVSVIGMIVLVLFIIYLDYMSVQK